MSKLFLNMKDFKKVASDKNTSTFQHKHGHTITVSHKSLTPKMRAEMEALPMSKKESGKPQAAKKEPQVAMAKGGEVKAYADGEMVESELLKRAAAAEDQAAAAQAIDQTPAVARPMLNIPESMASTQNDIPQQQQTPTPDAAPTQPPYMMASDQKSMAGMQPSSDQGAPPAPTPAAAQPQSAQMDPYGDMLRGVGQGVNEQLGGIYGQAKVAGEIGQQRAKALDAQMQQQQLIANNYKEELGKLDSTRQQLTEAINSGHIDPQHYINNMSTGSKVASTLGIILGGMATGFGGQNVALDMLNKSVDQDIDAQKANLGKQENLLSHVMHQYNNLNDATKIASGIQKEIVASQLDKIAAQKAGSLEAQRAAQAAGGLRAQVAQQVGPIAMKRAMMKGELQQGAMTPDKAAMLVEYYVPKEAQPEARKELGVAMNTAKMRDEMLSGFDQVAKINTLYNRTAGSPFQGKKQVDAITGHLVAGLSKETAGKFTEQDAHMISPLFPAVGDSTETLAKKRAELLKIANEKMNFPTLMGYGIHMNGLGRYDAGGTARVPTMPVVPPIKR